MKIVTSEEIQQIEQLCDSTKVVSESQMAETAGYGVAREIDRLDSAADSVILCGPGNNGADGMIAAFYLSTEFGHDVEVVLAAEPDKLRPLGKKAYRRLAETDVQIYTPGHKNYERRLNTLGRGDLPVDALLGAGQMGPPRGEVAKALDAIGGHPTTIAVDVPTGIDSDTGEALGPHAKPFLTLCIGLPKPYLFTGKGREFAVRWKLLPVGIPSAFYDEEGFRLVGYDLAHLLPKRTPLSHKRSSVVLSVAGSRQYPGAAALVASAAMRMGAGMVVAAGPPSGLDAVRARIVEAPLAHLTEADGGLTGAAATELEPWLAQADAVVIGPGLGRSTGAGDAVEALLTQADDLTWVIDGDALFHIADRKAKLKKRKAILTPHAGEAARLLSTSPETVDDDRFSAALEIAEMYQAIVILKGAHPIIANTEGEVDVVAPGTALLATAGTGDVLSGMLGALAAQKLAPREAAVVGASVHGYLAEVNTVRLGGDTYGVLASELAEEIPVIVTLLNRGQLYPACLECLASDYAEDDADEDDS